MALKHCKLQARFVMLLFTKAKAIKVHEWRWRNAYSVLVVKQWTSYSPSLETAATKRGASTCITAQRAVSAFSLAGQTCFSGLWDPPELFLITYSVCNFQWQNLQSQPRNWEHSACRHLNCIALCWWCSSVGSIWPWPSAYTGLVCSQPCSP